MRRDFGLAFHVHHADNLVELCYSLSERRREIKTNKPLVEQSQRLRLLALIPDRRLPKDAQKLVVDLRRIHAKCKLLDEDYHAKRKPLAEDFEAKRKLLGKDYDAKRKPLESALVTHRLELEALHTELCPNCPWDGHTIFPAGRAL